MVRPKKKIKIKEPVRLREKQLKDGNKSLYLDIYHKGVRKYEYLKLYIVPIQTPADRINNERVRQIAEDIKAERILSLQSKGIKNWENIKRSSMPLTKWMQEECEQNTQNFKPATIKRKMCAVLIVKEYLDMIGKPSLGLDKIDRDFCLGFIQYLRTAKNHRTKVERPLSQNSQNGYQRILCASLYHAVREGILKSNPFATIVGKERISQKEGERAYLTLAELKRFIDAPCLSQSLKQAFLFSCFTGLRLSDILRLCPKYIQKSADDKTEYIRLEMKKTESDVVVPLSKEAKRWLPAVIGNDTPYFTLPSKGTMFRYMREWAKAAGVDKNITFHSARHTFATSMLTLGTDIYTTSKLLGHKNVTTTQIYAKVIDSKKVESVARLDRIFENLNIGNDESNTQN
jgi:integrase/recombinase XerD